MLGPELVDEAAELVDEALVDEADEADEVDELLVEEAAADEEEEEAEAG